MIVLHSVIWSSSRRRCLTVRSSAGNRRASSCTEVCITASGFRSSCPIDAATWPIVASRSASFTRAMYASRYVSSMIASSMSHRRSIARCPTRSFVAGQLSLASSAACSSTRTMFIPANM